MQMKAYFFPWLFILIILLCFNSISYAANFTDLVWVIIDQLSLEELRIAETKNIDYLQEIGAFSLMNVRTAGHLHPESTYLSAGAGNRSQGSKNSHIGKNKNNFIVNDRIEELKEINKNNYYNTTPGLLGKKARENGITISVIGNCDTVNEEKRTIVSMFMDERGLIPHGNVGKGILKKVEKPWGYESDFDIIKKMFFEYLNKVDAIVIETGDLTRVESCKDLLTRRQLQKEKIESLERIDKFIGFIINTIDLRKTQLGIIVPTPAKYSIEKGNRLSWLLLAGKGINHGWLTSQSTRRKGVVVISDLLPTFLNTAGAKSIEVKGFPIINWKSTYKTEWKHLENLNDRITLISNTRPVFIKLFIGLQLLVIVMAIVHNLFLTKYSIDNSHLIIMREFVEYLLLSLYLFPVNYLIISHVTFGSAFLMFIELIILNIIEVFLLTKFINTRLLQIIIITLIVYLTIAFDLLLGNLLMADSLLGYSSVIGARYYGLGNEYMGIFIGSSLITITGFLELLERRYKLIALKFIPVVFGLTTYFIGSATLGANFGGTITSIFVYFVTWLKLKGEEVSKLTLFKYFIISIIFVISIIIVDYLGWLGSSSHIGRIVEPLLRDEWDKIYRIIYRKLSMNLKLLRWTIWTRVLLAFILYLIFQLKHPVGIIKKIFQSKPYLAAGLTGGISGSVVTMFVNDSGVVAAATLLFYPVLILLDLLSKPLKKA